MARTRQITIAIGAYHDRSWYVTMTEAVYESGRTVGAPSVKASRWASDVDVLDQVVEAVQHALDMEAARVELSASKSRRR
jgi:hypothetical protein